VPRKYNAYRFVFRWSTRVRREGGSLSITIPRYVARRLGLKPGDELLVRLTEEGIVLRPRYFQGSVV
jgi:AbrB family looped-hinge helix DNA binding protein